MSCAPYDKVPYSICYQWMRYGRSPPFSCAQVHFTWLEPREQQRCQSRRSQGFRADHIHCVQHVSIAVLLVSFICHSMIDSATMLRCCPWNAAAWRLERPKQSGIRVCDTVKTMNQISVQLTLTRIVRTGHTSKGSSPMPIIILPAPLISISLIVYFPAPVILLTPPPPSTQNHGWIQRALRHHCAQPHRREASRREPHPRGAAREKRAACIWSHSRQLGEAQGWVPEDWCGAATEQAEGRDGDGHEGAGEEDHGSACELLLPAAHQPVPQGGCEGANVQGVRVSWREDIQPRKGVMHCWHVREGWRIWFCAEIFSLMLLERQTCGEACVRTIGHGWACLVRSGTWARVEEEIEMEVEKGEGGFVAVSYIRRECRNSCLIC